MRASSPTTFSAAELLEEYIDLLSLGPEPEKWAKLKVTNNAPRYYRFQRIAALFRAFDLEPDYAGFPRGYFLEEHDPAGLEFLQVAITSYMSQKPGARPGELRFSPGDAVLIFRKFFSLLREVRKLQGFNSGWLEAGSGAAQYLIATTQAVVTSLDPAPLQVVIGTLSRLVDPQQRTFSLPELIQKYDFPDVNLLDIDIDWM